MFRGNGNVLYFDHGGSFTGIYIYQNQSKCTLQMGESFACILYLNKVDFLKTPALEFDSFCCSPSSYASHP